MARKKPRIAQTPQAKKKPRTIEDISSIGRSYFRWRVNNKYVDYDHKEWGWGHLSCKDFFQILVERLHDYEQTTWDDLSRRQSCHPMPIDIIEPEAQGRLCELCGSEVDSLYQVDISQRCRLWGYRDRTIFYLIWHDPEHTVYKV
ncbi:hypothetical protein ACFLXU_05625 [Chloroflexota bacterium]